MYVKVMQKRQRRRVPRQKAARDDAEKDEFVVEIKVKYKDKKAEMMLKKMN